MHANDLLLFMGEQKNQETPTQDSGVQLRGQKRGIGSESDYTNEKKKHPR